MVRVISAVQFRVLFENRIIARLQCLPDLLVASGNPIPSAYVAGAAVVGAAVRYGFLDGGAHRMEIVGQIACVEVGLYGHHAATDVDSHRGRNNGALRGDHTTYRRANAPMHVRHGGNPLKNERKLCNVKELLTSLVFELHSFRPRLNPDALLGYDYVVGWFRHFVLPRLPI